MIPWQLPWTTIRHHFAALYSLQPKTSRQQQYVMMDDDDDDDVRFFTRLLNSVEVFT